MEDFIIREARREDCEEILKLVQELANFESMPNGPKIGVDVLQHDGFDSPHPLFKCFVAEPKINVNPSPSEKIELVGYALYYYTYSTWMGATLYLEDLYITPSVRSKGVGSALFDCVATAAYDSGCQRMDFVVLKWNPATEFYKHKGAVDLTATEQWHHFRLGYEALATLSAKKNMQ